MNITMIKKLIPINPETQRYVQVDTKRLMRETRALLDFIDSNVRSGADEFQILKYVRPLCELVLADNLPLPMPSSELPLKYYIREGMLPSDFEDVYSSFALTVSGTPRVASETIYIDGVPYEYAEFEV